MAKMAEAAAGRLPLVAEHKSFFATPETRSDRLFWENWSGRRAFLFSNACHAEHERRQSASQMPAASLEQIIPELRDAIGPVILISGVGLLLLTMTNRLGRAIDRARQLKHELSVRTGREHQQTLAQVTILYRRAKIVRLSITLAATSAALAAVLIMTLFVTALFQLPEGFLIGLIFVACMASLLASLIAFICDINLSLHALKLELEGIAPEAGKSDGK
jgi:hypothetical protein